MLKLLCRGVPMKLYKYSNRDEYIKTQIKRSQAKLGFCKVFFQDILRYKQVIDIDLLQRGYEKPGLLLQPILCLGVRSGAEVDMFRAVFLAPFLRMTVFRWRVTRLDDNKDAWKKIRLSGRFGIGSGRKDDGRVMGVEINPAVERPDIYVGSFDELPDAWTGKFRVLYSNSFDHTMNPEKTMVEWRRVAAQDAYLILAFTNDKKPTVTDPLGGLSFEKMAYLWQAPIVFASETLNRTGYSEICFRL